jgi:CxxC motif-containing protein (DUF1111 family)
VDTPHRFAFSVRAIVIVGLVALGAGCESAPGPGSVSEDSTGAPMAGLSDDQLALFRDGETMIERVFLDTDGLGPLYVEASCRSCHGKNERGPGKTDRMAIANADGTTASDESALPFGTVIRPQLAAGATHPLLPPDHAPGLLLSTRFGPALFGRGRMEAVSDQSILDEETHQAIAGRVSGHANRLPDGTIGRFGVKARIAALDTFVADAFHSDMGLTSTHFPTEFPNPDGLTDDLVPGIDVADEWNTSITFYLRTLAAPTRTGLTQPGAELLQSTGCLDCHVNTYQTGSVAAVKALEGIAADLYTDLLLHDMGTEAADGITDGLATGREWKTAPLLGLRFFTSYLHDGRAATLDEAVRMHAGEGSEANSAVQRYEALSEGDRQILLDHLGRL